MDGKRTEQQREEEEKKERKERGKTSVGGTSGRATESAACLVPGTLSLMGMGMVLLNTSNQGLVSGKSRPGQKWNEPGYGAS